MKIYHTIDVDDLVKSLRDLADKHIAIAEATDDDNDKIVHQVRADTYKRVIEMVQGRM